MSGAGGRLSVATIHVHDELEAQCEATAAFIVRACNSHAALVEALKSIVHNVDSGDSILRWSARYSSENELDSDDQGTLDAARAALKLAREDAQK